MRGGPIDVRAKGIFSPRDAPAEGQQAADTRALFDHLFPGVADPRIDANHAGIAITAASPKLALQLAKMSRFMALELEWCQRADLRELAILTVNLQLGCAYGFETRLSIAQAAGLDGAVIAAIPEWASSRELNAEQRLVVEYARAVIDGAVTDGLFARVVERFGQAGAVEFTSVVGFWSCWAMILNATL